MAIGFVVWLFQKLSPKPSTEEILSQNTGFQLLIARAEEGRKSFEARHLAACGTTIDSHVATRLERTNVPLVEQCKMGDVLFIDTSSPDRVRVANCRDAGAGPIGCLDFPLSARIRKEEAEGRSWLGVFEIDEGDTHGVWVLLFRLSKEVMQKANAASGAIGRLTSESEQQQIAKLAGGKQVGHA